MLWVSQLSWCYVFSCRRNIFPSCSLISSYKLMLPRPYFICICLNCEFIWMCMYVLIGISVDFGGQPGHVPPIIEKRPCIYHFLLGLYRIFASYSLRGRIVGLTAIRY